MQRSESRALARLASVAMAVCLASALAGCASQQAASSTQGAQASSSSSAVASSASSDPSVPSDSSASAPAEVAVELRDCAIEHDSRDGGVRIQISIEDFNAMGFSYGDGVDISFSNGYTLQDLPYLSGSYVDSGEALLVARSKSSKIKATINSDDDLW